MLKRFLKNRPNVDLTLCRLFKKDRLKLPVISLQRLFENFEEESVTFWQLPRGGWSTPLADVVMLLKVARCIKPKKLMEVGSFRGYTALFLAQHVVRDARIVTVDRYPEHGEAYRDSPYAARIERRVGETSIELFKEDDLGSFDFIFLDAGHRQNEVKHDTELLLPLLAKDGFLLWHDYANWGYFNAHNGVPEYLHELSATLPIAHILGSDLAIYSPSWVNELKQQYQRALMPKIQSAHEDPWETEAIRG